MTEQWGKFELELAGPQSGNPFTDVQLSARFEQSGRAFEPEGFYDGDGVYRVRFMPDAQGTWTYITSSNVTELDGVSGEFECTPPAADSHGPVRVHNTFHFAHADGTPHHSIGTTCYVWNHQGDAQEELTLETLKTAPFNKIRMCVFPKFYPYNKREPERYPFEGEPITEWDYTRFNPDYFQHLEMRIGQLRDMGIQADLILFHPYDHWGFKSMDAETDDRYLRYIVARVAAYNNVWWSMANEFDLMDAKTEDDWDRFFQIVQQYDPYDHLRSVHNCRRWYDHTKPWVTHCSVQDYHVEKVTEWRETYGKPIVDDECRYEGNIPNAWGNISPRNMTRLFWEGTVRGGYMGHGETYLHPETILWWSHGGVLHGESAVRIQFYRDFFTNIPLAEYDPIPSRDIMEHWHRYACLGRGEQSYIIFTNEAQPGEATFKLPDGAAYTVTIIDTWEMTTTEAGTVRNGDRIDLPSKPLIALHLERV